MGSRNAKQHFDPMDNKDELTSDSPKVKFRSVSLDGDDSENEEAKVDITFIKTRFRRGKEKLQKYASEPFRVKMLLAVFSWIVWIGLLSIAIAVIMVSPKYARDPRLHLRRRPTLYPDTDVETFADINGDGILDFKAPPLDWYQKTAMYQVDVKTFKDSDGDGIGDFKGLISKLDYFKNQSIGTLMLSAFYESSDHDDAITDHKKVDSQVGTIDDFEELISELNEKDIKLVIDFNPNHSSDQHHWFIDSVEKKEPYDDFYIWADGENNWLNVDGGSAWTWNEMRQQYYLSTFGEGKPDLNLRNLHVREELERILRFWLEKGVHGFKVVAASYLVEDEDLREEPLENETVGSPTYNDVNHIYTVNQRENLDLIAEWRSIISSFATSPGLHEILIAEVSGSLKKTLSYYKKGSETLADLAFNTQMAEINKDSTPIDLKERLESWSKLSHKTWPTFLVGSPKTKRLATRVGDEMVDAMHMVTILAKGTPITYYGDELGMVDLSGPEENGILPESVMPWSNETNAGFSNGSYTVQIHPDYETINVQTQRSENQSHLNIFKHLITLREQPAISIGLQEYPIVDDQTFSMMRVRKGSPGYLVVINFSTNSTVVDFSGTSKYLPKVARVEIRSKNLESGPLTEGDYPKISLKDVPLEAKQSVVFSFIPKFKRRYTEIF